MDEKFLGGELNQQPNGAAGIKKEHLTMQNF